MGPIPTSTAWGADTADTVRRNPRKTAKAFLSAALAGEWAEAASMGAPGSAYSKAEKVKEIGELKIEKLAIASVYANDRHGLAITENVKDDRGREGPLLFRLIWQDEQWWIKDIDLQSTEKAKGKLERFLEEYPDAKAVADEVQE